MYVCVNKLEQENKWPGTPGLAYFQKKSTVQMSLDCREAGHEFNILDSKQDTGLKQGWCTRQGIVCAALLVSWGFLPGWPTPRQHKLLWFAPGERKLRETGWESSPASHAWWWEALTECSKGFDGFSKESSLPVLQREWQLLGKRSKALGSVVHKAKPNGKCYFRNSELIQITAWLNKFSM